jgi:FtsP/CotA-like multicopper oxidase with cupredoxin domain
LTARPVTLDLGGPVVQTWGYADTAPGPLIRARAGGAMMPYRWTINGATFDRSRPLLVRQGERVRLQFVNRTTMFHPMHVHGHTFALTGGGTRKDTVTYHAESGMMINLAYQV